jgi:hypothetical protein
MLRKQVVLAIHLQHLLPKATMAALILAVVLPKLALAGVALEQLERTHHPVRQVLVVQDYPAVLTALLPFMQAVVAVALQLPGLLDLEVAAAVEVELA